MHKSPNENPKPNSKYSTPSDFKYSSKIPDAGTTRYNTLNKTATKLSFQKRGLVPPKTAKERRNEHKKMKNMTQEMGNKHTNLRYTNNIDKESTGTPGKYNNQFIIAFIINLRFIIYRYEQPL